MKLLIISLCLIAINSIQFSSAYRRRTTTAVPGTVTTNAPGVPDYNYDYVDPNAPIANVANALGNVNPLAAMLQNLARPNRPRPALALGGRPIRPIGLGGLAGLLRPRPTATTTTTTTEATTTEVDFNMEDLDEFLNQNPADAAVVPLMPIA